jgi:hypothetical protein
LLVSLPEKKKKKETQQTTKRTRKTTQKYMFESASFIHGGESV